MYFYLDSSALVKHYAPEPGSEIVDRIVESLRGKRVIVSLWILAEVIAALNRKKNAVPASTEKISQQELSEML
ncbi:MAG: type II toxin-antitoxin system VapC family toxin [Chloroflexi bacterium]|nr:type II toxin-antitoxin system VapC family toxin [Chloroflexota bacterium]